MTERGLVAGAQSVRGVPRRAGRGHQRQRGHRADGRHPAGAGRGPGARRQVGLRHARSGWPPASTPSGSRCCSRCWSGGRRPSFADLDVFVQVTRRRPAHRAGRRSRGRGGAALQPLQPPRAGRRRSSWARSGWAARSGRAAAVERRIAEAARLGFRRVFGSSRSAAQVPGVSLVAPRSRRAAGAGACRVTSASSSSPPGRGTRLGGETAQAVPPDLAGVPMVLRALRPFTSHPDVAQVVLVLPAAEAAAPPEFLAELRGQGLILVAGGEERSDSVAAGLARSAAGVRRRPGARRRPAVRGARGDRRGHRGARGRRWARSPRCRSATRSKEADAAEPTPRRAHRSARPALAGADAAGISPGPAGARPRPRRRDGSTPPTMPRWSSLRRHGACWSPTASAT